MGNSTHLFKARNLESSHRSNQHVAAFPTYHKNKTIPFSMSLLESVRARGVACRALLRLLLFMHGRTPRFQAPSQTQAYGVSLIEVPVSFPLRATAANVADVAAAPSRARLDGARVRMTVFSHVASQPTFLLPVGALAELCRGEGVLSLIDGAHALGQVRVHLDRRPTVAWATCTSGCTRRRAPTSCTYANLNNRGCLLSRR